MKEIYIPAIRALFQSYTLLFMDKSSKHILVRYTFPGLIVM